MATHQKSRMCIEIFCPLHYEWVKHNPLLQDSCVYKNWLLALHLLLLNSFYQYKVCTWWWRPTKQKYYFSQGISSPTTQFIRFDITVWVPKSRVAIITNDCKNVWLLTFTATAKNILTFWVHSSHVFYLIYFFMHLLILPHKF